jgi:hypothetical protein
MAGEKFSERKTPEDIAKEAQERINKEKEAKAALKPEAEKPKIEAEKPVSEADKAKLEADKAKQAEADKAKTDASILAKEEKDLTEPEKVRKVELLKAIKEDPVAKRKAEIQTDINKLISEKKALENEVGDKEKVKAEKIALEAKIKALENEKAEALKGKEVKTDAQIEAEEETSRLAKYAEEDKEKERQDRREMSHDELEEWLLEDQVSAYEWISRRTLRRDNEKSKLRVDKQVKNILNKHHESALRTQAKYPDLDVSAREKELLTEGKSKKEIFDILCKENEKYRVGAEILKEHPDWLVFEDAPERIVAEMGKRMNIASPAAKKEEVPIVDLEKVRTDAAEAERQRIAAVDAGITSGPGAINKKEGAPETDFEKAQAAVAAKAGISPEALKKAKERRSKIPGSGDYKGA